ncbi:hypothetical protein C4577_02135 [Candidatus Parcubacteria bacterium]|nr:MAG: hypothetical protein C4577_02135 [Candidatus Parcubacteria bacterium]
MSVVLTVTIGLVVGFAIVAFVMFFLDKGALKKILDLGRIKVGDLGDAAGSVDPVGVLKLRRKEEAAKLAENVRKLKSAQGDLETLDRQISENRSQMAVYEARIRSAQNLNNQQRAEDAALSLAHERKQEVKNVAQRDKLKAKFDEYETMIKHIGNSLKDLDREAAMLGAELETSELEKNLSETLSGINVSVNAGGIAEARENIKRAIDKNRGAVKVEASLNGSYLDEIAEQEEMRRMEAQKILKEFENK